MELWVEGESDRRFWAPRLRGRASVRSAGGRDRALERAGATGGLALIDADHSRLLGEEPGPAIWTDACDLESTLLGLPGALPALLWHLGIEDPPPQALAELQGRALPLGRLRLWNQQRSWSLPFHDLPWDLLFDQRGGQLRLREEALLRELSGRGGVAEAELRTALDLRGPAEQLCQGHDLLALLSLMLRRGPWARLPAREVEPGRLQALLFLGVQGEALAATAMAQALEARLPPASPQGIGSASPAS